MSERCVWVNLEEYRHCCGALLAAKEAALSRANFERQELNHMIAEDEHSRRLRASQKRMERLLARCEADLERLRRCGPVDTLIPLPVLLARNLVHYTARQGIRMELHHLTCLANSYQALSVKLGEMIKSSRPQTATGGVQVPGSLGASS